MSGHSYKTPDPKDLPYIYAEMIQSQSCIGEFAYQPTDTFSEYVARYTADVAAQLVLSLENIGKASDKTWCIFDMCLPDTVITTDN